jgi:predicted TIM-barrel enzyme
VGFSGIQNFPTVGLIDGTFRANLEETGMSYGLEVDLIRLARSKDMLTTPYVFNAGEAEAMAKAGADIIVCHLGLTTGGSRLVRGCAGQPLRRRAPRGDLTARRTVKKAWQAAWLVKAIRCIDLTTLAGDDTPGRVHRLCAKARRPAAPRTS